MRHSQSKTNTSHVSPNQGDEGAIWYGLRALPAYSRQPSCSGQASVFHADGDGSEMCQELLFRLSKKESLQPMQEAGYLPSTTVLHIARSSFGLFSLQYLGAKVHI